MRGTILSRLAVLEARYNLDPLIVLASTDSGEEIKITMRECIEREDTHFLRVVSGSCLEDLDAFLRTLEVEALQDTEG